MRRVAGISRTCSNACRLAGPLRHSNVRRVSAGPAVEQGIRAGSGYSRYAAHAGRRSLRLEGSEGADPRATGRAKAEPVGEGADPVLRGPSRSRKDIAWPVHRAIDGAQIRAP